MRDFDAWLSNFKKVIAGYKYYTDFDKVYSNVNSVKVGLNIMNYLIGSHDIENDFVALYKEFPVILRCIPILLAKREYEIPTFDKDGEHTYNFKKPNYSAQQYSFFMKETGLFELMSQSHVKNLVDYVTGIETGLDSNGRKNRGGDAMEDLVERYLVKAGLVQGITYFKEMYIHEIQDKWSVDLSCISNDGDTEKRFDFVIKRPTMIYGIETNFYASNGSKLNETARSYKTLAMETQELDNFAFVWITDGQGWKSAKHNLKETFDVLEHLYCIAELENGIISKALV